MEVVISQGREIQLRGKNNNGSDSIEFALAELYGGIRQQIIFFAAEIGVSANWTAERISALLSPQRAGLQHNLPTMQLETAGIHRGLEQMEMVVHAHRGQTPVAITAEPTDSEVPKSKGHLIRSAQAAYWARMTPAQRAAEMARRLSKRGNLTAGQAKAIKTLKLAAASRPSKAKQKPGVKIGANGHKYLVETPEQIAARKRRYHERYQAKKRGETQLPLVPKAVANA